MSLLHTLGSLRVLLAAVLLSQFMVCRASGPFQQRSTLDMHVVDSLAIEGLVADDVSGGENARLLSSGLAVLLGPFGAHRLYLGTTPKVAVIYGLTFGGFGVLVLIDLGHLLFTKDLDRYRNSDRVFMWNEGDPEVTPP